jgi:hypothetical protein
MEALRSSCTDHLQYPKNLINYGGLSLNETKYFERLKDRKDDLFVSPRRQEESSKSRARITVDFLELKEGEQGLSKLRVLTGS